VTLNHTLTQDADLYIRKVPSSQDSRVSNPNLFIAQNEIPDLSHFDYININSDAVRYFASISQLKLIQLCFTVYLR